MAVVGVDEAGKGPVLGSMFAAAVRWPDGRAFPAGVTDSKRLSADRRERLDGRLRAADGARIATAEVPVDRIDDPATGMNELTVEAHARAVAEVAEPGDVIRCDAADVDAERYAGRLEQALRSASLGDTNVRAEHRADERHDIVGAASVVAKLARDEHVADLEARYGEIGSGYPSDPTTLEFLEAYVRAEGRLPACARTSWDTSKRTLAAAEQTGLSDFRTAHRHGE